VTTDTTSVFTASCRDLFLAGKARRYADAQLHASHLAGFVLLLGLTRMLCFVYASATTMEVE
jgi:hypothetical protein